MESNYKPETYNSASPYLIVGRADDTIDFLVAALDAVELRRFTDDAGRIIHAEVRIDDTVIMLAESTSNWAATLAHIHVYLPDADVAYERALSAGAESIQAVKHDGEDKRGGVQDANGIIWWLATKVA